MAHVFCKKLALITTLEYAENCEFGREMSCKSDGGVRRKKGCERQELVAVPCSACIESWQEFVQRTRVAAQPSTFMCSRSVAGSSVGAVDASQSESLMGFLGLRE